MCGPMLGGGGGDESWRARASEEERQNRVNQGMTNIDNAFAKFDQPYFDTYSKKLVNYWLPDIDRQFDDANNKLAFAFGSTNPGGSSASAKAFADLKVDKDRRIQEAYDNSVGEANKLRQNIDNQRGAVTSQLNATSDFYSAGDAAVRAADTLSSEPVFSPLGDLFTNITDQYATAQQAARTGAPGWGFNIGGPAGGGTFKKSGSMKVIG